MTTRKLTDFAIVEQIYNTHMQKDFPVDEIKPLDMIRQLWNMDVYECYTLSDEDAILGYAFFVRRERDYLLDYLAIAEEHRNEGLGTLFLRQLKDCIQGADCIVVEVEDPDRAKNEQDRTLRERRLQFYLRSGYLPSELTARVFGVDFRIIEAPAAAEHTAEELRTVYTELYRSMLPAALFLTQFQVKS